MTDTSALPPVAGLTIIAFVAVVIYTIRAKIYGSGNKAAITLLKVSDMLVMIRFIAVATFLLIFMAIAMSTENGSVKFL